MLNKIREKLAFFIAPVDWPGSKDNINKVVNQRVAEITAHIDPIDFLVRDYNGIFSEQFERPEENLNDQGKLGMYMWAYTQKNDPHFQHMVQWIMDSAGNYTLKKAPIVEKVVQYGRAQIANMILFKKEIGRLSSEYEDIMSKGKVKEFDSSVGVED